MDRDQKRILSQILELNHVHYEDFMADFSTEDIPSWKVDQLCNWINNEFMMRGLAENDQPNEYGLQLEQLLDVVNRLRLRG